MAGGKMGARLKVKRVVIGENKTFVGGEKYLKERGIEVVDVRTEAEEAWTEKIVDSFVDGSSVMSACRRIRPSR